ncbi:MAG: lysoplasmalogenase [Chloroflexi bacterium]|jgi:uncharacterized membrane protein YhhN|nr:lysoplasmalogenase [Chloroflexota bacterium]
MKYRFLYIALYIAIVNWIAATKKWKWLVYLTKPAVILAIMAYVWRLRPYLIASDGRFNWLIGALLFSLVGDILLMLPGNFFTPGLVAFLLGHVAYIISFAAVSTFTLNAPLIIVVSMVSVTANQIYRQITRALEHRGNQKLKIPVLIYTSTISVMLIMALNTLTSNSFETYRALFASGGALLFSLSDTWLAWDRFVEPLPWRNFRVMATYHVGQAFLCLGFLMTF